MALPGTAGPSKACLKWPLRSPGPNGTAPASSAAGSDERQGFQVRAGPVATLRCAIYTRVSTDQGLAQDFNSLDAQYEASSAYIKSQAHAGWTLIRSRYDDG